LLFKRKFMLACVLSALISTTVTAFSGNHYLPLKVDPLFELELEKLATVAKMPLLAKPYHLATVNSYLDTIAQSHPQLHGRIKRYLTRYRQSKNITQLSVEAGYSNVDSKNLTNARGQTSDNNLKAHLAGYIELSDNLNFSVGGSIYQGGGGFIPHNTYLSYSHDYFQLDLGYKELWLSPLQESAMLLSTQAKPIARVSLSSPKPLTDWQLRYDLSYGKLEEMQGIELGDELFSGRPGFLTMHFSGQPLDWWTLGVSRTFVFGGGPRDIGASEVWKAIIDPVNGDNCGGASGLQDCSQEAGNQQASISSKFDVNWGTPVSLYLELAGEDTNNFKPYLLGNKAYNVGLFLPYLSEKSSMLMEYQHIENAWYVHGLYAEGYRNDLNSMGHWWGDEKNIDDGIGAKILTLRYNRELSDQFHFDIKLATVENQNLSEEGNYDESIYQRGNELTLGIDQIDGNSRWRYQLYLGNDVFGKNFTRASIEYRWK